MPSGSAIKSAKDLAGKKVAVNTLNNINTTTINEIVRKDGGDPSGIQYVELAFPDIPAAVSKGDVDAGQVVEPFLASGTGQGMTNIGSNYAGTAPNLQVAMYFTSVPYMQQNADGHQVHEGDEQVTGVRTGAPGRGSRGPHEVHEDRREDPPP